MHIEDALDRYILQLRADGRSIHTIRQYERHVRLLASWLRNEGRDLGVESIDHEVLAHFLTSELATHRQDGNPKRTTSMNALRSTLRTFFSYIHDAGIATSNQARLVRRARCGTLPPKALTKAETARLIDVLDQARTPVDQRDRVLFRLMLVTGIRVGSAVALDIEDVDLDGGELTLRRMKNDRPGRMFLPSVAIDLLRPLVEERSTGALFIGRSGRRLSTRHVHRRLWSWVRLAGIQRPVGPHALRHTFAMRIYERTGDLLLTQAALRHTSVISTMVYARLDDRRLRQALAG